MQILLDILSMKLMFAWLLINMLYQKYANFTWCSEHEGVFNQNLQRSHYQSLSYWNNNKWKYTASTYTKNVILMPQRLLNTTATTTVNAFNNWNAYCDKVLRFLTLLSYYLKVYLAFKNQNKQKVFWCWSNILKSLKQIWSEHIKPAHSTHFHQPKN